MSVDVALVLGEALVDVVRAGDDGSTVLPGGSSANVAVTLARLGRPVRLATCFAADAYGDLLAAHLRTAGVGLAADPYVVPATSMAQARLGPDGAASYEFAIDWQLGELSLPAGDRPVLVHTSSYGAVLAPGAERVRKIVAEHRPHAVISYDVNARTAVTGTGPDVVARVEELVAAADLVKASDEDLTALWPDESEADVVARLLALGPAAVLITRGAGGATAATEHGILDVEAPQVEVADTIGAGDTFAGATLDALLCRGWVGPEGRGALREAGPADWTAILGHAVAAAAVTVSRAGADPPYRHELRSGQTS